MQLLHLPTLSPTRAHNQTLSSPPHLPDHRRFRFSTNPSSSQVIAAFNGFQGDPEPGLQPAAWTPLLPLPSASQPNRRDTNRSESEPVHFPVEPRDESQQPEEPKTTAQSDSNPVVLPASSEPAWQ
ncbi:uncharacterized protein BKA78DRAFT_380106 [Phyllosticta capitalensis]|uniref:uncharacterized protein n=1 Tax=Phyllosticta capitalensis TaxID=121624 RepID=UPI00312DCC61